MTADLQSDNSELLLAVERPVLPRDQRIRELFERSGPLSTRALVSACLAEGIFTKADVENAHIRAFQGVVREALSASDRSGLPAAGPSAERDDDGAPVWKQRRFWLFEDYESNVRDLLSHRNSGHAQAVRLAAECARRFDRQIDVPRLPDDDIELTAGAL